MSRPTSRRIDDLALCLGRFIDIMRACPLIHDAMPPEVAAEVETLYQTCYNTIDPKTRLQFEQWQAEQDAQQQAAHQQQE